MLVASRIKKEQKRDLLPQFDGAGGDLLGLVATSVEDHDVVIRLII